MVDNFTAAADHQIRERSLLHQERDTYMALSDKLQVEWEELAQELDIKNGTIEKL